MKTYSTESIRNVGITGHGDTGKTQLTSALLHTAGMTPRFGKVTEGLDVVDKIKAVATGNKGGHGDVPVQDVVIQSIRRA